MTEEGSLVTSPTDIARELRRYWSAVFSPKPCNFDLLRKWFQEEFPEGPPWGGEQEDWSICEGDVDRVISHSPASMPGPDGIPYKAWRRLGLAAKTALYEAAIELQKEGTGRRLEEGDMDDVFSASSFNLGTFFFYPKR